MARWRVGVVALAFGLLAGGAQAEESQPFQQLPLKDRAYTAIQHLERAGYFTGAPAGTFDGSSLRTRYEFAVAVERVFRSFQPRVLSTNQPESLLQDLRIFRLLLSEFSGDIAALGPDVKELTQQVDTMEQRLKRMLDAAPSQPSPAAGRSSEMAPPFMGPTYPDSPLTFGIRSQLRLSLWFSPPATEGEGPHGADRETPVQTRRPFGPSLKPGLAAQLGPALVGFETDQGATLTSDLGMPLADPEDSRNIHAYLTLQVGNYLATAWYNRLGANWDPFGEVGIFSGSPAEELGGSLQGSLTRRLGFQLQGGALRTLVDDPTQVGYVRGGLNYHLGRFRLGAGYERYREFGLLGGVNSAYYLGISRNFGRLGFNATLRSGENSSAVTQISIRF